MELGQPQDKTRRRSPQSRRDEGTESGRAELGRMREAEERSMGGADDRREGDGEEGEQEDKEKGKEAGVTISDLSYDAKYLLTNTQPSPECWRER